LLSAALGLPRAFNTPGSCPHAEAAYEKLVSWLDRLVDEVGEDESHPLASLMEIVGVLLEKYEDGHVPEISAE
jgi:HTH-type transcriptional regulator/antitoxin HigA